MTNGNYGSIKILANTAARPLADIICSQMTLELCKARVSHFKDGDPDVQILENIRGHDVFIVADIHGDGRNLMEAVHLAAAARLSSAARVTYVITKFGGDRGDRKDKPRKPIAAKITVDILETAKPDRVIVLEIHAEQTLACFNTAVSDHLFGSSIAIDRLRELLGGRDFVVASPDRGGGPRAEKYANLLNQADFVFFSKTREAPGEIKADSVRIVGDVKGKVVLFVDDMIDSAGTILADAKAAREAGSDDVYVFATHGLFTEGAYRRLNDDAITRVFVSDSVAHDPAELARECPKIEVLSSAPLLAKAIRRTHEGESLSELIL